MAERRTSTLSSDSRSISPGIDSEASRGKKPSDSAAELRTLGSGSFRAAMRGGTALADLFHPHPSSKAALARTSGLSLLRSLM